MSAYIIDTSVFANALNVHEQGSQESREFLEWLEQERLEIVCPTLLITEIAAALSRALDNHGKGLAFAMAVRDLPNQTLVPLDEPLAVAAAELTARHRLRGADAVYAAVAERHGAALVTNDRQQLERLSGVLPVMRPAQALAQG